MTAMIVTTTGSIAEHMITEIHKQFNNKNNNNNNTSIAGIQ